MKTLIMLSLISLWLSTTAQTPLVIQKAHQSVTIYMKKNLNDPSSYKPVSFYKLVKIYSTPDTEKLGYYYEQQILLTKEAMLQMDTIRRRRVIALNNYDLIAKDSVYLKAKKFIEADKSLIEDLKIKKSEAIQKFKLEYHPYVIGYIMRHVFRARNAFNALMLSSWDFTLSTSGNIVSVETRSYEQQKQDLKDEYLKTDEMLRNKNK